MKATAAFVATLLFTSAWLAGGLRGEATAPSRELTPAEAEQAFAILKGRREKPVTYSYEWNETHHGRHVTRITTGRVYVMEFPEPRKGVKGPSTMWHRSETVEEYTVAGWHYKLPRIHVFNDTGGWFVYGRIAVGRNNGLNKEAKGRSNKVSEKKPGVVSDEQKRELAAAAERIQKVLAENKEALADTFSGEEFQRDGQTLWRITRSRSLAKVEYMEAMYRSLLKGDHEGLQGQPPSREMKAMLKKMAAAAPQMPMREEVVYDPEQQFEVERRTYDAKGKLLKELIRKDVRREDLDESFFKLPEGLEYWDANSLVEFGRFTGRARDIQREEFRKAHPEANRRQTKPSIENRPPADGRHREAQAERLPEP